MMNKKITKWAARSTGMSLLTVSLILFGLAFVVSMYSSGWAVVLHGASIVGFVLSIVVFTIEYIVATDTPNAPVMGRWIPISEKTPPDGVPVLTYPGWATGGKGFSIDEWQDKYKCFLLNTDEPPEYPVTHWMPMTPPDTKS